MYWLILPSLLSLQTFLCFVMFLSFSISISIKDAFFLSPLLNHKLFGRTYSVFSARSVFFRVQYLTQIKVWIMYQFMYQIIKERISCIAEPLRFGTIYNIRFLEEVIQTRSLNCLVKVWDMRIDGNFEIFIWSNEVRSWVWENTIAKNN